MQKQLLKDIHCRNYNRRKGKRTNDRDTRAMIADRFVTTYRAAGLDRPTVAKLLHVSERTLHNWETGIHDIPYAAYKLVRILARFELPDPAWRGWHMHSGKLWTPEGHGIKPTDCNWWSLLCRRAEGFAVVYEKLRALRVRTTAATASGFAAGGGRRPLDLSLGHFRTRKAQSVYPCAFGHGFRVHPCHRAGVRGFKVQGGAA